MNDNQPAPKTKPRRSKISLVIVGAALLLIIGSAFAVHMAYRNNLKPASSSPKSQLVTIPIGSTPGEIATILEKNHIIRQAWAFEWFVRNRDVRDKLQAGTYALKPSQSVAQIVSIISGGRIATDLVTIFPSKRIDQVRDDLINQGFEAKAVDAALNPDLYQNHPALADKPAGASLEGYLYPESFQKTAQTTAQDIIKASLDQMQLHLTPEVQAGFAQQGLTIRQGVTLASILEQEVGNQNPAKDLEDKKMVAQVFLLRLKQGKNLESDVTVNYGNIRDEQEPGQDFASQYNTYKHAGLPVGPISNMGKNSLMAVAYPAATDYLFFVAGDDHNTYFSRTLQEHQNLVRQHCTKNCPQ